MIKRTMQGLLLLSSLSFAQKSFADIEGAAAVILKVPSAAVAITVSSTIQILGAAVSLDPAGVVDAGKGAVVGAAGLCAGTFLMPFKATKALFDGKSHEARKLKNIPALCTAPQLVVLSTIIE